MMNTRVEMNEAMMEQVVGGYSVGQHVEVRTRTFGLFEGTAGGTITKIATDDQTGEKMCYIVFDHWYDAFDSWVPENCFE